MKSFLAHLGAATTSWKADKASRLGAALAYYALFSIAPLLIIIVSLVGLIYSGDSAQAQIITQIQGALGPSTAELLSDMMQSLEQPTTNRIALVVGTITTLLGAIGLFIQLQDALNTIFEVEPTPGTGVDDFLHRYLLSFLLILFSGTLLLASLVASITLTRLSHSTLFSLTLPPIVWSLAGTLFLLLETMVLVAILFKKLPGKRLPWKNVWYAALLTSILFTISRILLSYYFSHAAIASTYGAAGSLVVLLLWMYYSAQIFLFGAELIKTSLPEAQTVLDPSRNIQSQQTHPSLLSSIALVSALLVINRWANRKTK